MIRWCRLVGLFVVLALVPFGGCGQKPSRSQIVLEPKKTGITTLRLQDSSRNRPLLTEVWYPIDQNAPAQPVGGMWIRCPEARDAAPLPSGRGYPLVVVSHGNRGDRLNVAWLAEILAANGFIVAAVDHHGNTWNNVIPDCFLKLWERPQDISFVIDELLGHPSFGPLIQKDKIGFIGYSLGGHTGLWVAGGRILHMDPSVFMREIPTDQVPQTVTPDLIDSVDLSPATESYLDARVSAFFLIAPALGHLFDHASLQAIEAPVHIVASEGDSIVPFQASIEVVLGKLPRGSCMRIPGAASHYVFMNEATKGGKMMLDKSIVLDAPSVNRKQVHSDIGLAAIEFFDEHLD